MLERVGHKHVDVMSLDVESHEEAVLAGLNFSRINIDLIMMEPSCKNLPGACARLQSAGYQTVVTKPSIRDTVWSKKAFVGDLKPYRCQHQTAGNYCRGWDYRGMPDYANLPP